MLLYCQKTNPRVEKKVRARDVPYITKEWKAQLDQRKEDGRKEICSRKNPKCPS